MSSRKKTEEHNMFGYEEFPGLQNAKDSDTAQYAIDEGMTIPNFDNRINKDSGWNRRKNTR